MAELGLGFVLGAGHGQVADKEATPPQSYFSLLFLFKRFDLSILERERARAHGGRGREGERI